MGAHDAAVAVEREEERAALGAAAGEQAGGGRGREGDEDTGVRAARSSGWLVFPREELRRLSGPRRINAGAGVGGGGTVHWWQRMGWESEGEDGWGDEKQTLR
jgi:hypothetical protein